MKKYSLILALSFGSTVISFAQNVVTVQSSGSESFYTNLDTALAHAGNGDYIYVPGGSYTPANNVLVLTKSVNIIGTGHFADSSLATGQTIINGSIRIVSGSDGGSIQGLYVTGSVYVGNNPADMALSGYSISRCYVIGNVSLSYNAGAINTTASNINISENVISNFMHIAEAKNVLISKNIFLSYIGTSNGQVVCRNNMFLLHAAGECTSTGTFQSINGTLFYDNIINNLGCSGLYASSFTGNAFYNNIFSQNISFPFAGNPGSGNIVNQPVDSIYTAHTLGIYNEQNNYHLRPSCLGKNSGSDGTDIGLYGSAYPYKEGAVPMNPHVSRKTIAPQTDTQGNLNINIKVAAQDR